MCIGVKKGRGALEKEKPTATFYSDCLLMEIRQLNDIKQSKTRFHNAVFEQQTEIVVLTVSFITSIILLMREAMRQLREDQNEHQSQH